MQPAMVIKMNDGKKPGPERRWRLRGSDSAAVAARLVELRLAFGYRYTAEWAKFLGLHPTTVANYEAGTRMINVLAALRYTQKTGVSLDWIYRGLEFSLPVGVQEKLRVYRAKDPDDSKTHR